MALISRAGCGCMLMPHLPCGHSKCPSALLAVLTGIVLLTRYAYCETENIDPLNIVIVVWTG